MSDESVAELSCSSCNEAISDFYFRAGGSVLCNRCRLQAGMGEGDSSPLGRMLRAGLFGLVAAAVSAGVWIAVIDQGVIPLFNND